MTFGPASPELLPGAKNAVETCLAIKPGERVIICDDLLATGGTAAATAKLIQKLGGKVEGTAFAVELTFLNGRAKLPGLDVFSLIQYDR